MKTINVTKTVIAMSMAVFICNSGEAGMNLPTFSAPETNPPVTQAIQQAEAVQQEGFGFSRHKMIVDISRDLAGVVSSTFNTSLASTNTLISLAIKYSAKADIDPLLTLAVIAKESSFRHYDEKGEVLKSSVGAEGAMQVWWKWHPEKLAMVKDSSTPEANIKVGTKILKGYIQAHGDISKGLKAYNGTVNNEKAGKLYVDSVMHFYRQFSFAYAALVKRKHNA